jgi:hypothetical protein
MSVSYVNIDGQAHLVVEVSRPFYNSSFIKGVLDSGGMFVVNPKDGVLKIHRPSKMKYFLDFNSGRKELAKDAEVACIQIEDHLEAGVTNCTFTIEKAGSELFKTTYMHPNQNEFIRQVRYAMKNF